MGRDWKTFEKHDRKSLDCLEQTVRDMDDGSSTSEDSEENEEQGRENEISLENT